MKHVSLLSALALLAGAAEAREEISFEKEVHVTVWNLHTSSVRRIFFLDSGTAQDLLTPLREIRPGERLILEVQPVDSCEKMVHVYFSNDALEQVDANLCADANLTITPE